MVEDPWKDFLPVAAASTTAASEVGSDPYAQYTSPGTPSPVHTPRAPQELTASPGEKYRAEAMRQRERMLRPGGLTGGDPGENFAGRPMRGSLFGWQDEIGAAVGTPAEMVRQGTFNPVEGYRYAKAKEKLASEARDAAHGGWGTGAELIGGFSTGAGVLGGTRAGANAASVLTRAPQTTIPWTNRVVPTGLANAAKNIGQGAALGAFGGAGEAEDISGIPRGMLAGGLLGGFVGGALPLAASTVGGTLRALQMPRLRDPEKVAIEQIAPAQRASGLTPQQIAQQIADARASGQPYTYADVLGYEAQRKLAAMAKVPGDQRNEIVKALVERGENMPSRVGAEINRGFGVQGTAQQAQETLAARAGAEAGPIYREIEQNPAWSSRLQEFLDTPEVKKGIRQGYQMEARNAVTEGRPFKGTDAMITNFNEAGEPIYSGVPNMKTLDIAKRGLDRQIEQSYKDGRPTETTRSLTRFKNAMLAELDAINPRYAEARRTYADPMQVRDAVDTGRDLASRAVRPEDSIRLFNQMREAEKQGVRIGYADKLQTDLAGTGNYPPLLRSKVPKGRQEVEAMTLDQGPRRPDEPSRMRKFLDREETMAATNLEARGGPKTFENFADNAAASGGAEALGAVTSLASGNISGVGSNLMNLVRRVGSGESEAQRIAITKALLQGNPDMALQMAQRVADFEQRRRGVNPWAPLRPPRYPEGD